MHGFASGSVDTIQSDYPFGEDGKDGCYRATFLVGLVAVFDDVIQSDLLVAIIGKPIIELAFVEVTCREVEVFKHEVAQVLKGVCYLVFRGVVNDVKVGQYLVFLHRHVLTVDVGVNRLEVPTFFRAFDEQSPHDPVQRVRNFVRDFDSTLYFAQ